MFQTMLRPYRGKQLYERQRLLEMREVGGQGERVHNHLTNNFHLGNKKALF